MEFENNYEIVENEEMTTDLANYDEFEPETEEESGIGTLAAMAIGAGITAAAFGAVALVKKGLRKLKAKSKKAPVVEDESQNEREEIEAEFEEVDVDDDNK